MESANCLLDEEGTNGSGPYFMALSAGPRSHTWIAAAADDDIWHSDIASVMPCSVVPMRIWRSRPTSSLSRLESDWIADDTIVAAYHIVSK